MGGKTLIIQAQADKTLLNAAANMPEVKVEVVNAINTYQILKYKNLLILKDALVIMSQIWGGKVRKAEAKTVKEEVKPVVKAVKTKVALKKVAVKKTVKKTKKVTKK